MKVEVTDLMSGILNFGTTDIWAGSFFAKEGCPVRCRWVSGLYPLDAGSTPLPPKL